MSAIGACPSCGAALPADAPKGFCPRCLYRIGFDEAVASRPAAGPTVDESSLVTSHSSLPPTFGDYELLEEIGHGGMGVVYKARQKSLDRIVALKLLLFGPHAPPESVKRFRAEAVATAALHHPNIVAIHEVGFGEGQHFIAMDYVEGRSLDKVIAEGGFRVADFRRSARWVKTVAEAVHYAHERGIMHRDLKPSNILMDAQDQPHVVDFGLAKRLVAQASPPAVSPTSSRPTVDLSPAAGTVEGPAGWKPATQQTGSLRYEDELTVTGQVLGSPNYMPPEQASGKRGTLSRRTDVYALGAILYHALTGRPPLVGEGPADTVQQVLNVEPVSPRVLNPGVPRDLETVCLKCLEKEPGKRYATAQLLAEELGRFLEGKLVLARPVGRLAKAWRWCRRKPQVAGLAAVAVLTFLLGFAGVVWQWRQAEAQRRRAEAGELAAQRRAYISEINSAQQALKANNPGRALELLKRHRPLFVVPASAGPAKTSERPDRLKAGLQTDLRGFKWRYLWQQCQTEAE
ncbi:MAG: serine/threonine protein kinase, partial [Chloroflexi bacterium]|nr:serine/threonine protein kinase [Chloroflexota bacterium]